MPEDLRHLPPSYWWAVDASGPVRFDDDGNRYSVPDDWLVMAADGSPGPSRDWAGDGSAITCAEWKRRNL